MEKETCSDSQQYFHLENLVYYPQIFLKCRDLQSSFHKEQIKAKYQDVFFQKAILKIYILKKPFLSHKFTSKADLNKKLENYKIFEGIYKDR